MELVHNSAQYSTTYFTGQARLRVVPQRIQWDSFSIWAIIALVICRLRGIFIASKRKPRYIIFFAAVLREELDRVNRVSVGNTRLLAHVKILLVPMYFFLWRIDYALEENILTERMWFLPLISYWEVMTGILIFCGYYLWSARLAVWCKSILFELFWKVKFFNAAR